MNLNALLPRTLFQYALVLLTLMGALIPWYFNLQFISLLSGFSIERFVSEGFANPAAASLSADLGIAAFAGVSFMIIEARRLRMRFAWLYVMSACLIAFACAFPLFLYVRELYLTRDNTS